MTGKQLVQGCYAVATVGVEPTTTCKAELFPMSHVLMIVNEEQKNQISIRDLVFARRCLLHQQLTVLNAVVFYAFIPT